jgi:hypothetical protein
MSDMKKCDLCGKGFDVHGYSYRAITLPTIDTSGMWAKRTRGATNESNYDICEKCLEEIRKTMRKLGGASA